MTLVLPYCSEQTDTRYCFDLLGSSKMPCVYEGEPLDFEAALMSGEWPALKDIAAEYEQNERGAKATPVSNGERSPKRRHLVEASSDDCAVSEAKKPCTDSFLSAESPFAVPSVDNGPPTSSLACSSPEEQVEDDDDDQYPPRRRGPQMWSSRQRWKDERKKVLKMSVGKLTEIEDPELWLLRSVLINNTIKRLHQDIRNEKQAKIKHRQQKVEFYHARYSPPAFPASLAQPSSAHFEEKKASPPTDIYDETSCDEIFGISEDFLRVTIPDRRMSSSPIPTASASSSPLQDKDSSAMEVDPSPIECDTTPTKEHHSSPSSTAMMFGVARTHTISSTPPPSSSSPSPTSAINQQQRPNVGPCSVSQCSSQFRTNDSPISCCAVDNTFPPRVPILDSVVYHSLLASLESS